MLQAEVPVSRTVVWMLALFLVACSGDTDSGKALDTSDTDVTACEEVAVDECATDSECAVITGREIVIGGEGGPNCLLAVEDLGCHAAESDCTAAETRAAAPDAPDVCYAFSSGCQPAGWVACDPDPGEATEDC
jgi:hypothetical protein